MGEPEVAAVRFSLNIQGCMIEATATLPTGPAPVEALLPIIQGLSERLGSITAHSAAQAGRPVSCHEGCGACCRHAVPISPMEARVIGAWMEQLPAERRQRLRERFREAAARLEAAGTAEALRQAAHGNDRAATHELGLQYFALGMACPFLEEERCTIHPIRPLRCREYLVVSPAENCAHPERETIISIKPPILLSQAVRRWNPQSELREGEMILLTMLEEWLEAHPMPGVGEDKSAQVWLGEFLEAVEREAQAVQP